MVEWKLTDEELEACLFYPDSPRRIEAQANAKLIKWLETIQACILDQLPNFIIFNRVDWQELHHEVGLE